MVRKHKLSDVHISSILCCIAWSRAPCPEPLPHRVDSAHHRGERPPPRHEELRDRLGEPPGKVQSTQQCMYCPSAPTTLTLPHLHLCVVVPYAHIIPGGRVHRHLLEPNHRALLRDPVRRLPALAQARTSGQLRSRWPKICSSIHSSPLRLSTRSLIVCVVPRYPHPIPIPSTRATTSRCKTSPTSAPPPRRTGAPFPPTPRSQTKRGPLRLAEEAASRRACSVCSLLPKASASQ